MAERHPRLSAVPDSPEVASDLEQPGVGERGRGRPLFWIAAAAFAICALGWFFEAREARELAASLETTRIALDGARAELRAYDGHLSEIGDRVGVLRAEFDSLQALVEAGPRREPEP